MNKFEKFIKKWDLINADIVNIFQFIVKDII